MSTFAAYNTDDPNAPSGAFPPLSANASITIGPIATGVASKCAGSVFSDVAGTCVIQQSFDYYTSQGDGSPNPTPHWDVVGYPVGTTAGAVAATTAYTIDEDVIAPVLQVIYTNGATPQTHLRLFVRVFGVNRG